MKGVRWILLAVLIGGLVAFAVAVPIGGQTLLERITGDSAAREAKPPGNNKPAAAVTDQLTEKDREQLNQLIEKKLEPSAKEGGEDKLPPKK